MLGPRLRQVRAAQQLSLNDVAERADISVATLSRIERDKQAIDVGLFLILCKVLKATPRDVLGDAADGNGDAEGASIDPMIRKIARMDAAERTKFWKSLSAANIARPKVLRAETRALSRDVEELLAQVDFLREQIEAVRKQLRRS